MVYAVSPHNKLGCMRQKLIIFSQIFCQTVLMFTSSSSTKVLQCYKLILRL